MGTPAERRALAFLAGLVTLGAGVQTIEARRLERPLAEQSGTPVRRIASDVAPTGDARRDSLDPPRGGARDAQLDPLATQLAAVDSARLRAGHPNRGGRRRLASERPPAGVFPPVQAATPRPPTRAATAVVDVETASARELEALPGIGPGLATRIVEDRDRRGSFGSPAGLERVRGVGPALVRKLAGRIVFGGVRKP